METEILEKLLDDLKELKEILDDGKEISDEEIKETLDTFKEMVKEGINEPCEIIIKKDKKGVSNIKVESKGRMALLLTLINAVKSMKEKYDISQFEWDFIEKITGYKDYK